MTNLFKKVKLDVSPHQQMRLRNKHRINITKKAMKGKGVSIWIKPNKFDNLNKHMKLQKGTSLQLDAEEVERNKMEGGDIFKSLKKGATTAVKVAKAGKKLYDENVKDTEAGKVVRGLAKKGAKKLVETGIDMAKSNPMTAPAGEVADTVYKKYGKKKLNKFIDEQSGLGLKLEGTGLKMNMGAGHSNPASFACKCPSCGTMIYGNGMGKEQFLLQSQNESVPIKRRGRPKKVSM